MDIFTWPKIIEERIRSGERYYEFLHVPQMSAGLYELPAGAADTQQPHTEDELYYVVEGQGTIRVAGEDRPVRPGTVVFVAAGVEHRFHSIAKDLRILVIFAPMRGSKAGR